MKKAKQKAKQMAKQMAKQEVWAVGFRIEMDICNCIGEDERECLGDMVDIPKGYKAIISLKKLTAKEKADYKAEVGR